MLKPRLSLLIGVGCFGVMLAACTPAAPPTEAPAAAAPAAAAFVCTDKIGCVDIAKGKPVHIAYAMVVVGPDATLGIDSMRGVEIAIDDKNKMLLGHPIELTGEDTGCNPEGGQAAAQKLAADKTIVAVVGTSCSSEARVAAPILTDAGLTLISASNTAPDLTSAAKHVAGYMRTAHNDEIQGAVAAEFAYYGKGITRAATIHDGSLYAQSLQAVFAKRFLELGGEIVAQEAVGPTDTDMRPVLTTIASAKPELIYFPIFTASGGFVTSQSKEVPGLEKVKLMGADGIFSPDFLKAAGAAALGMYHSSPDFSAFAEGYAAFLEKHQAKYGEKPLSAFHAHGYDAANIIFAAIEKVGVQDADGTLHIGRQALRDAMFATKDFKGITGTLTCTPTGDCSDPKIAIYQMANSDPASWNPGAAADSNPQKIYPFVCADKIGCIDITKGKPVHIAYAMVVAGPDATLGIDSRRGVEIAIDDKKNTLLGHPIELTGEDTGCNPEGGQAAAQKLAADKTIVAVVGTSCSSEARVAAPILTDAGLTLISASNTAPDLTSAEKHVAGYMRTAHNDEIQGAVAAEFAFNSKGIKRAATIHDGSLYAESLQAVFAKRFKELGGEIVAQEAVQPTDTDMRPVLTNIAASKPELIYFPVFTAAGGFITSQSKDVPGLEKVKLMGADGIFSPDFLKAAGAAAKGMYHSSPDFSAFAEGYAAFLDKHQAKYGEKPLSAFHAHGHDAASIIFAAIEKVGVGDADGTLHIGRQALRDAMFATKDFKGITGTLTCTPTGDCSDPKIAVYEMVNTDPASWNPGAAADSNPKKVYP